MVSLYSPAHAKVVAAAGSAADAYARLRNRGYLSIRALLNRRSVETLIQDTWDRFPDEPAPGESPREMSSSRFAMPGISAFLAERGVDAHNIVAPKWRDEDPRR